MTTGRKRLQDIAQRAMLARGLLPDFSPAALAEAARITQAAAASDAAVRDLRGLPWASFEPRRWDRIVALAAAQRTRPALPTSRWRW